MAKQVAAYVKLQVPAAKAAPAAAKPAPVKRKKLYNEDIEKKNKAALEQLKIHHAEKEADLVRSQSASATEKRLQEMGSELRRPVQPAKRTGKK